MLKLRPWHKQPALTLQPYQRLQIATDLNGALEGTFRLTLRCRSGTGNTRFIRPEPTYRIRQSKRSWDEIVEIGIGQVLVILDVTRSGRHRCVAGYLNERGWLIPVAMAGEVFCPICGNSPYREWYRGWDDVMLVLREIVGDDSGQHPLPVAPRGELVYSVARWPIDLPGPDWDDEQKLARAINDDPTRPPDWVLAHDDAKWWVVHQRYAAANHMIVP